MMKMQTMSLLNNNVFGRRKRCSPVCLFGAPDPVETEKRYEEEFLKSADSFLKKWNFNVFTMQPGTEPGGVQWEEAEDRLAAEVNSSPSPEGRMQDTNAEVNTCSPVGSRRAVPLRYSPYRKQQKLTDYWRTAKAPSLSPSTPNNRQPKKSEDIYTFSQKESPNVAL